MFLKVVIDTNVHIRFNKNQGVLRLAYQRHWPLQSTDTLQELRGVLDNPNVDPNLSDEDKHALYSAVTRDSQIIDPTFNVTVSRHPADNKFIALAVAAGANCIISEDDDLLRIGLHEGVEMIKPTEFWGNPKYVQAHYDAAVIRTSGFFIPDVESSHALPPFPQDYPGSDLE